MSEVPDPLWLSDQESALHEESHRFSPQHFQIKKEKIK